MQKSNWEKQMDDALADIVSINSALESNRRMVQFKAMFRVLELGLYDDKTISVLVQRYRSNHGFIHDWSFRHGHLIRNWL